MIDILLATFNGEKYLSQQIDSLLRQSNTKWRILAHDDGSTDGTVVILRKYQKLFPGKIIVIEDGITCGGSRKNFAHLIGFSEAHYVMFCDQDDVWLDKKIELTYMIMKEAEDLHPGTAILVHSDLQVVDESLNIISPSMFYHQRLLRNINRPLQLFVQNSITGCTVMVNRFALNVSLPIGDKAIMHDWWIGCKVLQSNGIILFISDPLVMYRQHELNVLGAKKVDIKYYLSAFLNFRTTINGFYNMWLQAKSIEPSLRFYNVFLEKLHCAFKRTWGVLS